jgi:hypothetical protein
VYNSLPESKTIFFPLSTKKNMKENPFQNLVTSKQDEGNIEMSSPGVVKVTRLEQDVTNDLLNSTLTDESHKRRVTQKLTYFVV